ncbi:HAMP domain-containing methyl-accepting chemotaxis protein [Paenibacillus sp. sptzw28]|uniref:methyl-accepting chemotaxis protein n=1 Tax=Paenibacillus sp. sptzw28 TaxID=715179 RepID=UPI001C6F53E7|nr:HAMP domain-containing methyl-accepting chemotaxis protein [Paenibacillus sp. sptzw28]QYR23253.1 HAMP domain-containing methyl-accepting chemotaxis protein [Paenibacillus sp. sptzw28]
MQKITRMSFSTKNLLLSFMNIVLIGSILIASGYFIEKKILIDQLQGQINGLTKEWAKGIDPAKVQQTIAEKSYQGPVQIQLRAYLDQVNKYNPNIAQAYIFGTELKDGNKTSLVAMPTNLMKAFEEAKLNLGDMYDQPKEVADALAKMLKSGNPTFTSFYTDDFGTWTTIAYPIKDAKGNIFAYFAADADASAVPNGLRKLLINGISIMAIFLVIIFLIQYFISRWTMKPIKELMGGIEQVSNGNLDVELSTRNDDLGLINAKFNGMVKRINDMMVKVQYTSHAVTDSAKILYSISEQSSKNVETITGSMQEITHGMSNQEQASVDGARAMAEMATVIQTIAANSSKVADEAYEMERKSLEGNEVVKQVAGQMEQIEAFVTQTANAITLLDSRSQEIGNIVSIITGISSQTNLLALNAAIEAARVGEHGKGFAVVAGEVRKLAEQSENSANQITEVIKEIQSEIQNAVRAMNQGTEEVRLGIQISARTGSLLAEILEATKNVTYQIQEISSATEEISAGTEELTATAENLSTITGRTAANSAKIAESIEEQKISMNSLVGSSTGLTAMSEELQELINQFHVRRIS